jgi:glutamate synthase domain-containing protein 3
MGCIMMRKCHLNTCPVGIATQDEELRKKFNGQPEHVMNYFFLLAEEIREIMSELGFKNMQEMIGKTDMLAVNQSVQHYKSKGLDLSPLLVSASELNPDSAVVNTQKQVRPKTVTMHPTRADPSSHLARPAQNHNLDKALDNMFIEKAANALETGEPVVIESNIHNENRTAGTMLSSKLSKKYGAEGLPEDTITIKLKGHGGQSMGFTLAKGIFMDLEGDANDYCGKGLSGGKIAVYPATDGVLDSGFVAEDNVVVGNVCLYGATSGEAFFSGKAGERFCVRNSGALAVVEGLGDHGAEYMTGGRLVCLGDTGRNFGAGMSGGIAYILDESGRFDERCNMGLVELYGVEGADADELKGYVQKHVDHTGSAKGKALLADWEGSCKKFIKVFPTDYRLVLEAKAAEEAARTQAA